MVKLGSMFQCVTRKTILSGEQPTVTFKGINHLKLVKKDEFNSTYYQPIHTDQKNRAPTLNQITSDI